MRLTELTLHAPATIIDVRRHTADDAIAQRLGDLGFVAGETLRVVARSPFGGDPLLVRLGATRFALRAAEADRVSVEQQLDGPSEGAS